MGIWIIGDVTMHRHLKQSSDCVFLLLFRLLDTSSSLVLPSSFVFNSVFSGVAVWVLFW